MRDEEKEERVKPDFSPKTIYEVFTLANQLTGRFFETNPHTERASKFKGGIQELLVPYKTVRKDMENKKEQLSLSLSFFILPNVYA